MHHLRKAREILMLFTLTVGAYVVATLVVQAISHFTVNAGHYAAVSFMRPDAIAALGVLAAFVQGIVLAYLAPRVRLPGPPMVQALLFAWTTGIFLVSYLALVEPAKYAVPSIQGWLAVELSAGFVQFTVFGLLLAAIRQWGDKAAARQGQVARQ
jgi:hypothetical protein